MPTTLRKLRKALGDYQVDVVDTGRGRHPFKCVRSSDGKSYPLPAHNGLKSEVGDEYIRGVSDCFEIDRDEFRAKL